MRCARFRQDNSLLAPNFISSYYAVYEETRLVFYGRGCAQVRRNRAVRARLDKNGEDCGSTGTAREWAFRDLSGCPQELQTPETRRTEKGEGMNYQDRVNFNGATSFRTWKRVLRWPVAEQRRLALHLLGDDAQAVLKDDA